MKKFTLFLMMALFLGSARSFAVENVDMPSPWGATCTVSGTTFTFNGSWAGAGTWLGDADKSAYDYAFVKYSDCTAPISFGVVYNKVTGHESWGDVYATGSVLIPVSQGGVVGVKLDKTSMSDNAGKTYAQSIRQVQLQDQGTAGSVTIEGIWFGTTAEYEEALAGGEIQLDPRVDLPVDNMNAGWSSSSDGNGNITISGSYGGRGWGWWNGGQDYTYYDYVVFVFAVPTANNGQVFIQGTKDNQTYSAAFDQKCMVFVAPLPDYELFSQICIQGAQSGYTYSVDEAFVCTQEYLEENGYATLYKVDRKDLGLTASDVGSGWGESSYDAATKTITIGDDWSGKGWWKGTADYSAYDKLVIRFADATPAVGKIVVEYDNGTANSEAEFDVSCIQRIFSLDEAGKSAVKQVYIQGPSGAKYELEEAYVCTYEYSDLDVGISDEYAPNFEYSFNGYGYGTFCYEENAYVIPTGVEVSYVSGIEGKVLQEGTVEGVIPADMAVILKGEPNSTVKFGQSVKNPDPVSGNMLHGADESVNIGAGTNFIYFLSAKDGIVGFYLASADGHNATSEAHKAWLTLTASQAANAPAFVFDQTTGIEAITSAEIDGDAPMYNLAGQRVDRSYKGVVIVKGKKIRR